MSALVVNCAQGRLSVIYVLQRDPGRVCSFVEKAFQSLVKHEGADPEANRLNGVREALHLRIASAGEPIRLTAVKVCCSISDYEM